jgi:competence protein ComEA
MSRDQQAVVLFLALLMGLLFFTTTAPSRWHRENSTGSDRLGNPRRISNQEVWVELDGSFANRGIYPIEKGQTLGEVLAKAGEFPGKTRLPPESLATKIEQSGRLNFKTAEEGKGTAIFSPLDPPKMKVLSLPVNINTARAEELDILPGIGPKMAQAIVDYRESHGRFSAIEDLLRVKGIGPKKFAALRAHITIQD